MFVWFLCEWADEKRSYKDTGNFFDTTYIFAYATLTGVDVAVSSTASIFNGLRTQKHSLEAKVK